MRKLSILAFTLFLLAIVAIAFYRPTIQPAGSVIVTIKPIHSLVAAVMEGTGEVPVLLVDGAASPHDYQLKPSQAIGLSKAEMVVYIDEHFETFLAPMLATLPAEVKTLRLADEQGLHLLPLRHLHEEEHDHDHPSFDPHLWLSPVNAKVIVQTLVRELSARYPQNAATYANNGKRFIAELTKRDAEWRASLAPLRDKPFLVFHDAYQYFEQHYGLRILGSLTDSPEQLAGAERLQALHRQIESGKVRCLFAEPKLAPRLVPALIEGTQAKAGILDPEGSQLPPGPGLYGDLMQFLVDNLHKCLD